MTKCGTQGVNSAGAFASKSTRHGQKGKRITHYDEFGNKITKKQPINKKDIDFFNNRLIEPLNPNKEIFNGQAYLFDELLINIEGRNNGYKHIYQPLFDYYQELREMSDLTVEDKYELQKLQELFG